jgi:hypothetical protein
MPNRYTVIVKIGNKPDGSAHCLKYRVTDLLKLTQFLDRKWPGWKWFNVYAKTGINKREQLASFTKNSRPISRSV